MADLIWNGLNIPRDGAAPDQCSRMQGIVALGQDQWAQVVDGKIALDWPTQVMLVEASTWDRASPLVQAIADILKLDAAGMEDVFRIACRVDQGQQRKKPTTAEVASQWRDSTTVDAWQIVAAMGKDQWIIITDWAAKQDFETQTMIEKAVSIPRVGQLADIMATVLGLSDDDIDVVFKASAGMTA